VRSDYEEQTYMVLYFIFLLVEILCSWPDNGLLMLKHVASYYVTNIQQRFQCFRDDYGCTKTMGLLPLS